MNWLKVSSVTVTLLAFLCSIAATLAPAWISFKEPLNSYRKYRGFFGYCFKNIYVSDTTLLNVLDGTKASGAFMIIGTIILLAGFILVRHGTQKSNSNVIKCGGITSISAGIAVMIGVAVFAGTVGPLLGPGEQFGASFGLAWIAFVCGVVGGILSIQLSRTEFLNSQSAYSNFAEGSE